MNKLTRYWLREQLLGCFLVLFVLVMIYLLLALIGELDDLGRGRYGILQIGQYLLLVMPRWIFDLLPGAALLGGLLAFGNLAANSEIIAMRAAGFSIWKMARTTLLGAVVLVGLGLVVGELLAPPLEQMGRELRSSARAGSVGAVVKRGVWLREGRSFIRIGRMETPTLLQNVDIFEIDESRSLVSSTAAEWARFDGESWTLENVQRSRFLNATTGVEPSGARVTLDAATGVRGTPDGRRVITESLEKQRWENSFSPDLLDLFVVRPDSLSSFELLEYVRFLHRNDLDAKRYTAALWHRLGMPLAILAMALLALPFVLGSLRGAGMGQRMVIGLLIGFGFFGLRQTLERTGVVYGLDPVVTGLAPPLVLIAITLLLIRRQL